MDEDLCRSCTLGALILTRQFRPSNEGSRPNAHTKLALDAPNSNQNFVSGQKQRSSAIGGRFDVITSTAAVLVTTRTG